MKDFTNSNFFILTIVMLPLSSLIYFYVQSYFWKVQCSERVAKAGGSALLSQFVMEYAYWCLKPIQEGLIYFKIQPNTITFFGTFMVFLGASFTAAGYFGLGGLIILLGSLSDMLDGMVARAQQICSNSGEYVDAMADRYADIALHLGVILYYMDRPWVLFLALTALCGSLMVSYARAKAESLGLWDLPKGIMQRAERAVYLGFSLLLGPVVARLYEPEASQPFYMLTVVVCLMIAILANWSAFHMMKLTHAYLQSQENPLMTDELIGSSVRQS